MILYHGSNEVIVKPDVALSRNDVDFGKGFYVTSIESQAIRWCQRFKRVGDKGVVSQYELDERSLELFSVKKFAAYDGEWLDFVMRCRRGQDSSSFDIVEGGIANDRVFDTIELYSAGLIDKEAALQRLAFERPNHQLCFRTQESIDACLTFSGSFTV